MVEINILKMGGLIVGERGYIQITPGVKDNIERPPHLNHKKLVSNSQSQKRKHWYWKD